MHVLCDCRMPNKVKGKFYRAMVRPVKLHGSKFWAFKV